MRMFPCSMMYIRDLANFCDRLTWRLVSSLLLFWGEGSDESPAARNNAYHELQ